VWGIVSLLYPVLEKCSTASILKEISHNMYAEFNFSEKETCMEGHL